MRRRRSTPIEPALADIEFDDEEEEFAPNNFKMSAADKPPKAFNEQSIARLSPSGDLHRRERGRRLAVIAKYDLEVRAQATPLLNR